MHGVAYFQIFSATGVTTTTGAWDIVPKKQIGSSTEDFWAAFFLL
jgi:hypothetical protein